MHICFFGASVSEQTRHHSTQEITGYITYLSEVITAGSDILISRVTSGSNTIDDAGIIYVHRVVELQPDICVLDWSTPANNDCDFSSVKFIYSELLSHKIIPLTAIFPRSDRDQSVTPITIKLQKFCHTYLQAIRARLDYFETIKLWKYGFPKANIVPRIFDPEEFKGGNLVYDFFSVFAEGDISQYYTDFEKVFNVSDLNLEGYLLLAMFNNYGKASISKYGTYTSSRKAIMEYLRTEFSGKPADFYTKDFALHIRDIFKDSNEKVRQEYFSWRKSLFDDSYIEYLPALPVARQLSSAKLIKYLYNAILSFKDYQSNC